MVGHCEFCGKGVRAPGNIHPLPWDTVLWESDNFVVFPTKGSLVPGWVLIAPKNHFICCGSMPRNLLSEQAGLLALVQHGIERAFGPTVVFEHGPVASGQLAGCGVDHAHLHVVPLDFPLKSATETLFPGRFEWKPVDDIDVTRDAFRRGRSYLYLRQSGLSFIAEDDTIPSQVFRRVIANRVGVPHLYDWKVNAGEVLAAHTVQELQRVLEPQG